MLGSFKKVLGRIGLELMVQAKRHAPVDEGRLKADIQFFDGRIDDHEITVGNSKLIEYAGWVHEGTGIHGPHKQRILPKKAKALNTPYGLKKSVAGAPAQPYLQTALDEYVSKGKLDKTLESFGDDVTDEMANALKSAFKNIASTTTR